MNLREVKGVSAGIHPFRTTPMIIIIIFFLIGARMNFYAPLFKKIFYKDNFAINSLDFYFQYEIKL